MIFYFGRPVAGKYIIMLQMTSHRSIVTLALIFWYYTRSAPKLELKNPTTVNNITYGMSDTRFRPDWVHLKF